MKVEQEGTGFAPITITLETREEADLMWAKLNTSYQDIASNSRNTLPHDPSDMLRHTNQQMFESFHNIYNISER